MIETISLSILTSTVITGLLIFLLKEYVKKGIEGYFSKRSEDIRFETDIRRKFYEDAISSFPALNELLYRISVITRQADERPDPRMWDPDIRELTSDFYDWLFKHKFYINDKTFERLHELKRILQDYLILYDVATRPSSSKPIGFDDFLVQFEKRSDRVAKIHEKVMKELKEQARGTKPID